MPIKPNTIPNSKGSITFNFSLVDLISLFVLIIVYVTRQERETKEAI